MDQIIDRSINGKGDSDRHHLTLIGIGLSLDAKNILELGVRGGGTTEPLLHIAKRTGGRVISVDIEETAFVPSEDLKPYWTFVKMDALEYLKTVSQETVFDIVYVDDWHSYDHVKNELVEIDRIVSPKSLVLLHDLMYGNWQPHYHSDLTLVDGQWAHGGPYRAVAELNPQFWEFSTIPSCNGLTILRKKYSNKYHN